MAQWTRKIKDKGKTDPLKPNSFYCVFFKAKFRGEANQNYLYSNKIQVDKNVLLVKLDKPLLWYLFQFMTSEILC